MELLLIGMPGQGQANLSNFLPFWVEIHYIIHVGTKFRKRNQITGQINTQQENQILIGI